MTYVVRRRLIARAGSSDFEIIILTTEVVSVLHFNLTLNDTLIEQTHEHRHLGVIIDDGFTWRPHITGTCKTDSKHLYVFSQFRHFVDTPKRKLFHHAHISSHLT